MNYKNRQLDKDPVPTLLPGSRYCVEADIAKCFPSIYTHSVEWALLGKEEAKRRHRDKNAPASQKKEKGRHKSIESNNWASAIDKALRNTTNGETHGILIGPHASNLISEIVLARVDAELSNKYKYIRFIDDCECYVKTYEEAQRFIRDLDSALATYRLSRNVAKTKIIELPYSLNTDWVRQLKIYPFPTEGIIGRSDIALFMDTVIELENTAQDQAVISYAIKMASGRNMDINARAYFVKMCFHLAYIYPYLMDLIEEHVIQRFEVSLSEIKRPSDLVFERAMEEGNYYSAYFALYFAAKYDFDIDGFDCGKVVESDDCMFKFFAFEYCNRRSSKSKEDVAALKKNAQELAESPQDLDENWIFVYETLDQTELNDEWKELKENKISFIKRTAFDF